MRKIVFSTESGSDLSPELIEKYNVNVVPMHIVIDGLSYLDQEITSHYVLAYYERSKCIPKTGPTTEAEYEVFFREIFQKHGPCTIVHMSSSSKLSQSYANAKKVQSQFEHLHVIDSQHLSCGLTALIVYAAKLLECEPHIEVETLIQQIEQIRSKIKAKYIANGTDFILASGRIENREQLELIPKNSWSNLKIAGGYVTYRSYEAGAIGDVLFTTVEQYIQQYNLSREAIYLVYSLGLSERIREIATKYMKQQGFEQIIWLEAGSMTCTHFGPGGFGLAGIEL